ncbi:MAG: DoxX family membrane protein [Myxococcaceae bacterium]|nr:DoxX family membrane protein [Myxococcaceae bacterium]
MKTIAPHVVRTLLGLVFFVFGLNGFLHFISQPPPPESAARFFELFAGSYLMPFVKGTEVVVGLMLLSNRFVPLALAVLAPITLNIFVVHATLAPSGLGMAVVILALQLGLAWTYRAAYLPMLQAKTKPTTSDRVQSLQPASSVS